MEITELRALAKEKGIKSYWNKKPETILKEMGFNMDKEPLAMRKMTGVKKDFEVVIDRGQDYLKRIGFKHEPMIERAQHMGADKVIYNHQYRNFELYKNNKQFDNLPVGLYLGD